jgi:hypothetical protein
MGVNSSQYRTYVYCEEFTPIANPLSSKFHISNSRKIPYFWIVLSHALSNAMVLLPSISIVDMTERKALSEDCKLIKGIPQNICVL